MEGLDRNSQPNLGRLPLELCHTGSWGESVYLPLCLPARFLKIFVTLCIERNFFVLQILVLIAARWFSVGVGFGGRCFFTWRRGSFFAGADFIIFPVHDPIQDSTAQIIIKLQIKWCLYTYLLIYFFWIQLLYLFRFYSQSIGMLSIYTNGLNPNNNNNSKYPFYSYIINHF